MGGAESSYGGSASQSSDSWSFDRHDEDHREREQPALVEEREHEVDDPDTASANYLDSLGWVLFKKGKFAEAWKALEAATKFAEVSENGVI